MTVFVVGIPFCNEPVVYPDVVAETFAAIERSSRRPAHVFVIDNGDVPWIPSAELIAVHDLIVERPRVNLGCAASWNRIYALYPSALILNADTAVAPETFEKMLAIPAPAVVLAHGFSCFRIDEEIRRRVGSFDEEFYPGYWEDTDYRRRMKLAGVPIYEWSVAVVATPVPGREMKATGITHGKRGDVPYQGWSGERRAWFYDCIENNKRRYVAKWGGMPSEERYVIPFGGVP